MEEKWKAFLFRTGVSVLGAVYSYLSSTTIEEVTWKMVVIVALQALISAMAKMPTTAKAKKKKKFNWRKYLTWL